MKNNVYSIDYYRKLKSYKKLMKALIKEAESDGEEIDRLKEQTEDAGYLWEDVSK